MEYKHANLQIIGTQHSLKHLKQLNAILLIILNDEKVGLHLPCKSVSGMYVALESSRKLSANSKCLGFRARFWYTELRKSLARNNRTLVTEAVSRAQHFCRTFSSISGLYPLDVRNTIHSLRATTNNFLQTLSNVAWRQNQCQLRNTALRAER